MDLIIFLIIGGICGWLASLFMKGRGTGIIGNIILGVIGSFVGGFVFAFLGVTTHGLVGNMIQAIAGAIMVIGIARMVSR